MRVLEFGVKTKLLMLVLMLAPVVRFVPENRWIVWTIMALVVFFIVLHLLLKPSRSVSMVLFLLIFVLTIFGSLFSSNLIDKNLHLKTEQIIMGQDYYFLSIGKTANTALIIPYMFRKLLFNSYIGLTGEVIGRALGKIISPEWWIVFLPIGWISFFWEIENKIKKWPIFLANIFGWLVVAGIQVLPDSRSMFYMLIPSWIFYSLQGLKTIPWKYYVIFLILSTLYFIK